MIIDRIVQSQSIIEELQCKICNDFIEDPLECSSCQNIFCRICIYDWKQRKNQCIFNCQGPFNLQKPHRVIRNLIQDLKFYCINYSNGCKVIGSKVDISIHQKECLYAKISCKHSQCKQEFLKKDEQNHQENCQFEEVFCQLCLKYFFFKQDFYKHHCSIQFSDLRWKCRYYKNGCKDTFQQQQIQKHQESCDFKDCVCPNDKCGKIILYSKLEEHLPKCNYEQVYCEDCHGQFIKMDFLTHSCVVKIILNKIKVYKNSKKNKIYQILITLIITIFISLIIQYSIKGDFISMTIFNKI